jgi:colanic acid/amylovoran biosynthesis glycosyltransferase
MIPVVAHSVNPYLPNSGSWIYHQIRFLESFRPIVLAKRTENLDQFPIARIYSVSGQPFLRRNLEKALARVRTAPFRIHRDALRREGAVLLHSHFADMAIRNIPLAKEAGIPHVASFYGSDIWARARDRHFREGFDKLSRSASLFLVEGPAMADKVLGLGAPERIVKVLRLGIDTTAIPFLPRSPDPDGRVVVLMAGRPVEKKGHWYGLLAFERICRDFPHVVLRMIIGGRTPRENEHVLRMRRFIEDKGIVDKVEWCGFLSYDRYLEAIRSAHIFLQPSVLAEDGDAEGGAPVTITELSASGMPVVATRHCDIPQIVLDGRSGLLAEERDVDGLATLLARICASPQTWEGMGRAGRAHVEERFDIRKQVRDLERSYEECRKASG